MLMKMIENGIGELIYDIERAAKKEKEERAKGHEVRYFTPELAILRLRALMADAREDSIGRYQLDAVRTINKKLPDEAVELHALHGMASEIGELHSIYQKSYQGHAFDLEHAEKELGDLLWFIAEWCSVHGVNLASVMRMNIEKLKARYPEGFEESKSLKRADGDI